LSAEHSARAGDARAERRTRVGSRRSSRAARRPSGDARGPRKRTMPALAPPPVAGAARPRKKAEGKVSEEPKCGQIPGDSAALQAGSAQQSRQACVGAKLWVRQEQSRCSTLQRDFLFVRWTPFYSFWQTVFHCDMTRSHAACTGFNKAAGASALAPLLLLPPSQPPPPLPAPVLVLAPAREPPGLTGEASASTEPGVCCRTRVGEPPEAAVVPSPLQEPPADSGTATCAAVVATAAGALDDAAVLQNSAAA